MPRAVEEAPVAAGARRVPPPVVDLPSSLRDALLRPSLPALAGLAVVVVVVAAVLGVRVVLAHQGAAPRPVTSLAAARPSGASEPRTSAVSAAPTSAMSAVPTVVVVDIAGAVRSPGLQRLPPGARVDDALTRAGGIAADADLTTINRARVLTDGEQVRVPRRGETPPPAAVGTSGAVPSGSAVAAGGPVDLNSADAGALDALPGIGPALAQRILQWRGAHGRFTSVDELGEVSGIGDATLERLRPLVRV